MCFKNPTKQVIIRFEMAHELKTLQQMLNGVHRGGALKKRRKLSYGLREVCNTLLRYKLRYMYFY